MSLNLERKLINEAKKEKSKDRPKKDKVVIRDSLDLQRWRIEKLQKNADKVVAIPERPKERGPPKPREYNPNIHGSTAGASSGDFHVYRNDRRREFARLKYLDEQEKKEQASTEFELKRKRQQEEDEARLERNRRKRQRKKQKKQLKKKDAAKAAGGDGSDEEDDEDDDDKDETDKTNAAANKAAGSRVDDDHFVIGGK